MAGTIRTKQGCPRCGGKFQGDPLRCRYCLTAPTRYFLDLFWPGQGRIKVYSGKDGHPLDSWERSDRLLNAIRHEIDLGRFDPKEYVKRELRALRFDIYAETWLERRRRELERGHISHSYFKEISAYIARHYLPFFGRSGIRDIREGQIEDFVNQLPPHLSQKTVMNILGVLHKLFKDAARRKDILLLPEFPRMPKSEPVTRWITEDQQELILSKVKSPTCLVLILFLMKQGCRPSEARALKWKDLDLKNDMVTICAAFDRGNYRAYTKERDVRYLPLHPRVKEALLSLPRHLSGWVFADSRGLPLTSNVVGHAWARASARAGIKISCYEGTRHSLASQAINRGVSERKVGDMLGHKVAASTRRYAKMRSEALREVWGEDVFPGNRPQSVPNGREHNGN